MTRNFFLVIFCLAIFAINCNLEPAGPVAGDLYGTWKMTTAVMTSTVTTHTALTNTNNTTTNNTHTTFTNNNDFYQFHSDMTYYSQFDDNVIGNTGMVTDTGSWTLHGTTLTSVSLIAGSYTSAIDYFGDSAIVTTRVLSDTTPGPNAGDYTLTYHDLAISAHKLPQ
jgi:hypothetical protein